MYFFLISRYTTIMRKDSEQNKKRILLVARQLQKEYGMKNITMREIAKNSNVGIGTLYRNFESKSTLYFKIALDSMENLIIEGKKFVHEYKGTDKDKLVHILLMYLEFREDTRDILENIDQSTKQMSTFYQSELYEELVMLLSYVISPMNPQLSQDKILFKIDMLIAMLKSEAYYFQRFYRKLTIEEIVDNLVMMLCQQ